MEHQTPPELDAIFGDDRRRERHERLGSAMKKEFEALVEEGNPVDIADLAILSNILRHIGEEKLQAELNTPPQDTN